MVNDFLSTLRKDDYQRDNFDRFLNKVKFSFEIPAVHVAGSNGKGTTIECMYKCLLKENKYKVGKFTSPYDLSALESIVVNDRNINEDEYINIINDYKKLINKYDLSAFEVETFVALTFFKQAGCDIVLVECGMGGEDDATNIFTPILSIITSVSLEHTSFLGSSLGEIALNKGGIIKEDIPLLIPDYLDDEVKNALSGLCKENNSHIFLADNYLFEKVSDNGYTFTLKPYNDLFVPSFGLNTLKDISIALSALKIIGDNFPVSESSVRDGVKECVLKGRMNVLSINPLLLVDGAHNPEAINVLVESLEKYTNKQIHTVFASFRDKNISLMLPSLNFISSDITLTSFPHIRAREKDEYFLFSDEYEYRDDALEVINEKMNMYPDDIVLVTGSLAFAYYVIDNLR